MCVSLHQDVVGSLSAILRADPNGLCGVADLYETCRSTRQFMLRQSIPLPLALTGTKLQLSLTPPHARRNQSNFNGSVSLSFTVQVPRDPGLRPY